MTDQRLNWTDMDDLAVDTARVLAMDSVQKAGNGHPGTAMSLAPAAYLLFQKYMRHDPADPGWIGRDRFVLSCGHSSLTLYTQLFFSGYGLELEDLESFRKWGSLTPGHPEYGHTVGVETTTGPLGQGLATAVGMAMGARYERGLFDPDAAPGESPFDHNVWVLCSDGDLEEGITSEASSLAGTQQLGNLTVIWDDNHISIEDDTAIAFNEDVLERYRAYGWHTESVEMSPNGSVDTTGLARALDAAVAETGRPSFIRLRTVIGWPAPNLRNSYKAHGSALGAAEVAATKHILGWDPHLAFHIPAGVLEHVRQVKHRGGVAHTEWNERLDLWRATNPDRSALLDRIQSGDLPTIEMPTFEPGASIATRKASGLVIQAIAAALPEFVGGSADLAESNLTTIEGAPSFLPDSIQVKSDSPFAGPHSPYGRVLHFGIREHAMGAAVNGMALSGLLRPFAGTFLIFSDYMRGAVRLSALMRVPVVYVWTHDSVGLGEDGPTHQPIEHLWSLRAMPGLSIVRPADATETAAAWQAVIRRREPAGLALTRQGVPTLASSDATFEGVDRGGYVLSEADGGEAQVLLLATGSEVHVALRARQTLQSDAIPTRVVSLPCLEWFDEQDAEYRESVLPPSVRARVSVEAGATQGWWKYVGDQGRAIGIDHFGASAEGTTLFREFGVTAEAVVAAASASLASVGN
ncbi:MAG: transketolase [Candidatus Nanopelagicales bacterium]|nr:transketolase [Candidatus Nanopelagicales bacterium]